MKYLLILSILLIGCSSVYDIRGECFDQSDPQKCNEQMHKMVLGELDSDIVCKKYDNSQKCQDKVDVILDMKRVSLAYGDEKVCLQVNNEWLKFTCIDNQIDEQLSTSLANDDRNTIFGESPVSVCESFVGKIKDLCLKRKTISHNNDYCESISDSDIRNSCRVSLLLFNEDKGRCEGIDSGFSFGSLSGPDGCRSVFEAREKVLSIE